MGKNSTKNRKTAFADVITDYKTRLNLREEDLFDLISQSSHKLKEGPYKGVVVESVVQNNRIYALVRIPEIHDYLIPNGCGTKDSSINMMYKTMLTLAVSKFTINEDGDQNEDEPENYNQKIVEITFPKGAPNMSGQMRGGVFDMLDGMLMNTITKNARFCFQASFP